MISPNKLKINNTVETVDIESSVNPTYVFDLTKQNNIIPNNKYDAIYCLEVLEHTSDPNKVLQNLYSILKKGGTLYLSVPFQFRLHGPLPDYWRFSEYGLLQLLKQNNFRVTDMNALIDPDREAFPLHYTVICTK